MKKVRLNITSVSEALDIFNKLLDESKDEFVLINEDESKQSDPKTYIGVIYALSEFDEIYLVNKTNDGIFPEFIK